MCTQCLLIALRCFAAGCLFLVHLMVTGDVFDHERYKFPIYLAEKKCSYSFLATMTKGILCNWLVCMAVWQGNAAQDVTGKLLGIWFPISAFVTSG
jgi:formate/nitrite transporter FocA (FNT family)